MKLSTDRILTTHVGSLPRPQALVDLLVKKDQDEPYDHAAVRSRRSRKAVADIVARQVAIGIDVVSDGETSKIGYATYIKERLTGFGGEPFAPKPQRDLADYPGVPRAHGRSSPARRCSAALCCIGDDRRCSDHEAVQDGRRQLPGGDRGVEAGRRLHDGGVAGRGLGVPAQPALSDACRLYRARSPTRCARNTRRSPTPASCCSSTAPISRWRATPASRT